MIEIAGLETGNKKKYSESYGQWREFNKNAKEPFYILPNGIKNYLPYFDGKAMNLYLYYCLHSSNDTGESWHSTKKCAAELQVTERSINNWNKILEEIGLIARTSNNRSSKSTFLLPISDYVITEYDDTVIDYVKKHQISAYKQDVDGQLVSIFNLFQWRKDKDKKAYDQAYNVLCLAFERKHFYKDEDKTFTVRKFVLLEENTIEQKIETSSRDLTKSVYGIDNKDVDLKNIFRKENVTLSSDVVFANLAVNTNINLKDVTKKEVLELLNTLCENRKRLEEIEIVE